MSVYVWSKIFKSHSASVSFHIPLLNTAIIYIISWGFFVQVIIVQYSILFI